MTKQLNEHVLIGDWKSTSECCPKSIINVAHSFSARRGRNIYWANLENMRWGILYFRWALRDKDHVTEAYMLTFRSIIEAIKAADAFPLLCHCQMGGHRGPTAALHASVLLGYPLEETHKRLLELCPGLINPVRAEGRIYYPSTLEYLRNQKCYWCSKPRVAHMAEGLWCPEPNGSFLRSHTFKAE